MYFFKLLFNFLFICESRKIKCIVDSTKKWISITVFKIDGKEKLLWKAKKNAFQATTLHQCGKAWNPSPATRPHPQHWGQSTAGWRPERVLLQVWKAKTWSDSPHPLWSSHSTAINTTPLSPPYCFSTCTTDLWRWCKQSLQESKYKESQRPRWCLYSLPQSLCCPAIIQLHIDLQQITGVLQNPLLIQMLHHYPCTQETKNHRT